MSFHSWELVSWEFSYRLCTTGLTVATRLVTSGEGKGFMSRARNSSLACLSLRARVLAMGLCGAFSLAGRGIRLGDPGTDEGPSAAPLRTDFKRGDTGTELDVSMFAAALMGRGVLLPLLGD